MSAFDLPRAIWRPDVPRRPGDEALDQPTGDGGRQQGLACSADSEAARELFWRHALEQEAAPSHSDVVLGMRPGVEQLLRPKRS